MLGMAVFNIESEGQSVNKVVLIDPLKYLKQNHRHKWEYLTSGPGFGPGGVNSFRSLPFIYSEDDLGDAIVKELKTNYRRFVKFTLTVFFTLPPLFIVTMLPWGS